MYSATLACGHKFHARVAPPVVGDLVPCGRCGYEYQLVTYDSGHYKIKCCDCAYTRYVGSDKEWAKRAGSRHAFKYVGHRVKLFQAKSPEQWEIITAEQEALTPTSDGPVPF